MKIIKELSGYISEELDDAEKYARLALTYKQEYPSLADLFNRLSGEDAEAHQAPAQPEER